MPSWTAGDEDENKRVDVFVAAHLCVARAEAHRIIESGDCLVNGASARPSHRIRPGDVVEADRHEPVPSHLAAEAIPLAVVYEDADVLVVDKPRGMVVHPAAGHRGGTLVNAVLGHVGKLQGVGGEMRPGLVHRLDKDTSGLLVIAKSDTSYASLQAQIQARTAERVYDAFVWGSPRFEEAEVEAPIGRHPVDRKKMAVVADGRHTARTATTRLTVAERLGPFARVSARLGTGRTHQIRVHCAYAGHPVVGDPLYGGLRKVAAEGISPQARTQIEAAIRDLDGQALHAGSLSFDHPTSGLRMSFHVTMPNEMAELLELMREAYGG